MQLKKYVPSIYNGVYEMSKLCEIEQGTVDLLESEFQLAFDRQFVENADESGVAQYEELLEITPAYSDTIDRRKEMVLLRLSSSVAFTLPYLKQQLDKIMGRGNYNCWVDFNAYTLYIQGLTLDIDWYFALSSLVHRVKPANIVYIYQPLLSQRVLVNETISSSKSVWEYKLGAWRLGEFAFYEAEDLEVYKLAATNSLSAKFLNLSATAAMNLIDHVVLNGDIVISTFQSKTVTDDTVTLEFAVPATEDPYLTSCVIYNASNEALSSSDFVIPTGENTQFKVLWKFKEGV